jgi:type IV secretory pathway protease TraF
VNRPTKAVLALAAALIVIGGAWLAMKSSGSRESPSTSTTPAASETEPAAAECAVEDSSVTVRGNSLDPLAPAGTRLRARFGYYACHPVRRGDLVYYGHAGGAQALAKVVKAIPGDRLALAEVDGDLRLLVNQVPVRTSSGEHYHLDRRARRMLTPYVRSAGGVVPAQAYLLLSDRNGRVVDGRHFGLVHHEDLLARLELP